MVSASSVCFSLFLLDQIVFATPSSPSFLVTFRLNFAYSRYWEAATSIHQMSSKWLDTAMCMCAFHYQSLQFIDIRPPTYASLKQGVTSDQIKGRERHFEGASQAETLRNVSQIMGQNSPSTRRGFLRRRKNTGMEEIKFKPKSINTRQKSYPHNPKDMNSTIPIPTRFQDQFLKPQSGDPSEREDETLEDRRKRWQVRHANAQHNLSRRAKLPSPSLFLQETAHLISLLSAVAMSTLRSDIDQAVAPVTAYIPGMAWPPVDPDYLSRDVRKQYGEAHTLWRWYYFCAGKSRSSRRRTMYNAARPFGVLGGVSDAECEMLQQARGPYAKVALCTMYVLSPLRF